MIQKNLKETKQFLNYSLTATLLLIRLKWLTGLLISKNSLLNWVIAITLISCAGERPVAKTNDLNRSKNKISVEDSKEVDQFLEEYEEGELKEKINEETLPPTQPSTAKEAVSPLQNLKGDQEIKAEIDQLTLYFCMKQKNLARYENEEDCKMHAQKIQGECLQKYKLKKMSIQCIKNNLVENHNERKYKAQ